jgi:hypothetical protein
LAADWNCGRNGGDDFCQAVPSNWNGVARYLDEVGSELGMADGQATSNLKDRIIVMGHCLDHLQRSGR